MYWADTTSGAIRVANLDGSGVQNLYTGESQASGVAINPATGKIYWADAITGTGAIRVGNLDGSGSAQDLFSNESYPVGVTIDPATGKIYWGSYDTFKIRTGNLDGTGAHDLFTGENYPTGIVVDDATGKIYWTNEFAGQIRVGNLDGTGAANLFAPKGGIGGLALDPGTGKLYWGDFVDQTIEVGNADGTGTPQSLFSNEPSAWFVALLRAPAETGAPHVTGSGAPGTPLSCSQGSWAGDVPNMFFYRAPRTFAYQWFVNGSIIPGATATTYTPTAAGKYTCQVTATNQAGSTSSTNTPAIASTASVARGSTTARFSGSVNPEGLATTAHFEYGLDPRYTGSSKIVYDQSTPDADRRLRLLQPPDRRVAVRPGAQRAVSRPAGRDQQRRHDLRPGRDVHDQEGPGAERAEPRQDVQRVGATGLVLIKMQRQVRAAHRAAQDPQRARSINALHGTLTLTTAAGATSTPTQSKTKKQGEASQDPDRRVRRRGLQGHPGRSGPGSRPCRWSKARFKGAPTYASCKTHKGKAVRPQPSARRSCSCCTAAATASSAPRAATPPRPSAARSGRSPTAATAPSFTRSKTASRSTTSSATRRSSSAPATATSPWRSRPRSTSSAR